MNIITKILGNDNKKLNYSVTNFFKEYNISSIMKESNFYKEKGKCNVLIFKFLLILVFTGKNFYRFLETEKGEFIFAKDTIYRFLNSIHYNWSKFILILAEKIINNKFSPLTSSDRKNVLIVDDSTYSRNRSKEVELLSWVRDHTTGMFVKGYKLLTLGWSDGNSFLPLMFRLLSSSDSKNRLCPQNKNIDKRSVGFKNRKSALTKKTDAMLTLLEEASKYQIPAKYVLFDSWFTFPKIIHQVKELGYEVIAMVKKMPKVFYEYYGEKINLEKLYSQLSKKRGKAKILTSVTVLVESKGKKIPIKIVFVRNKSKKRDWLAIISTDRSLSEEEIVRIYGKRWDIECFFKICKSYLKLSKEFQGRSYDSMVAHTAIVFVRYMMLSLESRKNRDLRSIGVLFYKHCDELQDLKFTEAISILFAILKEVMLEKLMLTKKEINGFLNFFLQSLPRYIRDLNTFSYCES